MSRKFFKLLGNDGDTGDDDAHAWSLAKLSTAAGSPGDRWSLRSEGETFVGAVSRTGLVGTALDPIVIDTYGSGAPTVFTTRNVHAGWTVSGNWTNYGATVANTWYLTNGNLNAPCRVWLDGTEFYSANASTLVNSTNRWFFGNLPTIGNRLLVYATSNPSSFYGNLESLQNSTIISPWTLTSCAFMQLMNMDIRGGLHSCLLMQCQAGLPSHHITVQDSKLGADGRTGIYCYKVPPTVCDHITMKGLTFDCGYAELGITYPPVTFTGDGVTLDGGDDCVLMDSTIKDFGHCGFAAYSEADTSCSRNTMTRCSVSGKKGEYMRGFGIVGTEGKMIGTVISFNEFKDLTVRNQYNGQSGFCIRNLFERMRNSTTSATGSAQGVELEGFATVGGSLGCCHDNTLAHNVFIDCDEAAIRLRGDATPNSGDKTNNFIRNNIAINCGRASKDALADFQVVVDNHVSNTNNYFENNDLYKSGVTNVVTHKGTAMSVVTWNALDAFINGNRSGDPLVTQLQGPIFGRDVPGATGLTGVFTIARPYVCPGPVGRLIQVKALQLYCTGTGAGAFRLAIYNSAATTKICEGVALVNSVPGTSAGGVSWQGYATPAALTPNPVFLVGGTTYMLVVTQTAANHTTRYNSGTTLLEYNTTDFTAGLPASLTLVSTSPVEPSIRVELELSNSDVHLLAASPGREGGVVIAGVNDSFRGSAPDTGIYEFDNLGFTNAQLTDLVSFD